MLTLLDFFLTLVHLAIICFNLFGWVIKKWRKAHLFVVALTAASWFLLGIWFGIGYCPITDWQWNIKSKLGETNLPNSFIKYYADKIFSHRFSDGFIDAVTVICFAVAAIISVYLNFFRRSR